MTYTADFAGDLADHVAELRERHSVPGAGIAVAHDGQEATACTGITSVENPLDIGGRTRFQIGSISKTFAVTAVLRLVTDGAVSLDRPVREYVPDLRLADRQVAATVPVRTLLNHTAGWDGTRTSGGSNPSADLALFVDGMRELEQVRPVGDRAEYNNAGIALAGRVVEQVTGVAYEEALRMLVLEPLGMTETGFTTDDLMTERCTVGHIVDDDGACSVARPWAWPWAANPEGGLVSTLADQLTWIRFHLGDGRAPDGTRLLGETEREAMRTPTVRLAGNAMGDAIGLGWFLRDVAGTPVLSHPGATHGQFAELRLVPSRDYGVIVHTNAAPNGRRFVADAVTDRLAHDLGLRNEPLRSSPFDPSIDGDVAGTYENSLARITVDLVDGNATAQFTLRPEAAAEMSASMPAFAPCTIEFLRGGNGEFVVRDGAFEGTTGSFVRGDHGTISEVDFGGRWYRRSWSDG